MNLDKSIQPLIIALNQAKIMTRASCSGIIEDHDPKCSGMGTPYLSVVYPKLLDDVRYKIFRRIMVDSGFEFQNRKTRYKHRMRFYEWYNMEPSKGALWEIEKDIMESYHFDFGLGESEFGNPGKHDTAYEMLDYPQWQNKIKDAWIEIYQKVLRAWF